MPRRWASTAVASRSSAACTVAASTSARARSVSFDADETRLRSPSRTRRTRPVRPSPAVERVAVDASDMTESPSTSRADWAELIRPMSGCVTVPGVTGSAVAVGLDAAARPNSVGISAALTERTPTTIIGVTRRSPLSSVVAVSPAAAC